MKIPNAEKTVIEEERLCNYLLNWHGIPPTDYNASGVIAMSFDTYQDVILTADLPENGLRAGDLGTLVERHTIPGKEQGCSVEFFDLTGRTVAVVTLPGSYFRAPTAADRPSTRTLSGAGV